MRRRGTPTCVYRVDAALVELLDARLGPPLDSYVRGWQVWLPEHGPGGARMEWRLHPPARFRMPAGVNPHDLFGILLQALAESADPDTTELPVGRDRRTLAEIWEVLEVFPADDDPMEPAAVAEVARGALGRDPEAVGWVDHDRLGDLFKGRRGDFSVGQALLSELDPW
jgi:hypothetical protein